MTVANQPNPTSSTLCYAALRAIVRRDSGEGYRETLLPGFGMVGLSRLSATSAAAAG